MLMDKTVAVASTGAIFLDRDGVINENRPDHVKSWDEFEFLSDVLTSVRRLSQTGMPIFVVTNQAAIGRGLVLEFDRSGDQRPHGRNLRRWPRDH